MYEMYGILFPRNVVYFLGLKYIIGSFNPLVPSEKDMRSLHT